MHDLIIVGKGGLAASVYDIAARDPGNNSVWRLIGCLDDNINSSCPNDEMINLGALQDYSFNGDEIFVLAVGNTIVKKVLSNKFQSISHGFITFAPHCIISKSSIVEKVTFMRNVYVGVKSVILPYVFIDCNTVIGSNCFINSYVHIGPQSVISDNVTIEEGATLHGACIIREGVKIGSNSIVSLGAYVNENLPSGCLAIGNPAKIIKL
jgi:acetyltransferase-like isoleucine patch superfamily enzyme